MDYILAAPSGPSWRMRKPRAWWPFQTPVLSLVLSLAGCSPVYYGTLERFGVEKRERAISEADAFIASLE